MELEQLWDVAIIGAGPAGASAALQLAKKELKVLLIDKAKFPRNKVCGCCLNPHAVQLLSELGLEAELSSLESRELSTLVVYQREKKLRLAINGGRAVSRSRLDAALVDAACQAGAHFTSQTTASLDMLHTKYRGVRLITKDGEKVIRARVVLGAEGLSSLRGKTNQLRTTAAANSFIGAGVLFSMPDNVFKASEIAMHCSPAGYLGLVRIEGEQVAAAAALRASFVKQHGGIAKAARQILSNTSIGSRLLDTVDLASLPWRGTPALTRAPVERAAKRFFSIGDAAGFVEPFTGEGMTWALHSAKLVCPIVEVGVGAWQDQLVQQWNAVYRRELLPAQRRCRTLTRVLRSNSCRAALFWLGERALIPEKLLLANFYSAGEQVTETRRWQWAN